MSAPLRLRFLHGGGAVVADGAVVGGVTIELLVAEMVAEVVEEVEEEVVEEVEEDGVNVVDILCCLFVACLLFVFVGCCLKRARVGCVWQSVACQKKEEVVEMKETIG